MPYPPRSRSWRACHGLRRGRPETVHAAPAYENGYVAFGSGQDGWWTVVDPDGSAPRRVTPLGGTVVQSFRYSPDGRHVAMLAGGQLWVADAAPTGQVSGAHKLVDAVAGRLAWSPDGSKIFFNGTGGVLSIPADGSSAAEAAFSDGYGCQGSDPQVTTRGYIFFSEQCHYRQIPALAAKRSADRVVVSEHGDAVVSADGSRIAWLEKDSDTTYVVHVADSGTLGGGHARDVARIAGSSAVVGFAPSGDIVFLSNGPVAAGGRNGYRIAKAADYPNAPVKMVASGIAGPSDPPITSLQWANGPTNLPSYRVADRIGGVDRIDTAVKASRWSYDGVRQPGRHATVAVLARADTFPDALTGTALAIQAGGPLLLTPSGRLDAAVAAELRRILAPASTVYLLGGTTALSPAVAAAVRGLGFTPVRLGGPDRYATALVIANAISSTQPNAVLIASGTDFPDALTAGVAAGQERYNELGTNAIGGAVVVLSDGKTLPPRTLDYLMNFNYNRMSGPWMYAIGGPAVAAMGPRFSWRRYTPVAGADRYDTAAKVATSNLYTYELQPHYTVAAVTTGLNFPDAMTGGALAGGQDGPLLLADANGLPPQEQAILKAVEPDDLAIVGGPAAVSPRAFTTIAGATFGTQTWAAVSNRVAPPLR